MNAQTAQVTLFVSASNGIRYCVVYSVDGKDYHGSVTITAKGQARDFTAKLIGGQRTLQARWAKKVRGPMVKAAKACHAELFNLPTD